MQICLYLGSLTLAPTTWYCKPTAPIRLETIIFLHPLFRLIIPDNSAQETADLQGSICPWYAEWLRLSGIEMASIMLICGIWSWKWTNTSKCLFFCEISNEVLNYDQRVFEETNHLMQCFLCMLELRKRTLSLRSNQTAFDQSLSWIYSWCFFSFFSPFFRLQFSRYHYFLSRYIDLNFKKQQNRWRVDETFSVLKLLP